MQAVSNNKIVAASIRFFGMAVPLYRDSPTNSCEKALNLFEIPAETPA